MRSSSSSSRETRVSITSVASTMELTELSSRMDICSWALSASSSCFTSALGTPR